MGSAAKPLWASPPREEKFTPAGAAKFVICDDTIKTFYQDGKGHLGFNEYRMRSAEAIGKHWCLVFVAYSLLHLTCLPAGPGRTRGSIQTIGDACRQQGRALLQKLLVFVRDQLSQGAPIEHVFTQVFAKQRGLVPV